MAFIQHNVDGFTVAWAAVNTQWMINVDGERTHTAWRQHDSMGPNGNMIVRVHYTSADDMVDVGDLARVVILEPKTLPIKFGVSPKHPNAVMIAKVMTEPEIKNVDAVGNKGASYFEQIFEIVSRDRKDS